jgi:solute carrier family 10 (sodium/bile acid cotransporter), member 7
LGTARTGDGGNGGLAGLMLARLFPDRFILILFALIGLATVLPAQGQWLALASTISNIAIFSLFFFHGLRLSHQAVWGGVRHWRLQLAVLAMSFALIPVMGLALSRAAPNMLGADLWTGILFLCMLPSTVQAAIASASMARGNVAASVVAAAISNLLAVVLTPLLFALIARVTGGEGDMSAVGRIMTLLLLPFILGQLARGMLGKWAERRRAWIGKLDRTTIAITVYVAFSAAVIEGLWTRLDLAEFIRLSIVVVILLALAFGASWALGKALGLAREDRVSLFFSGAHKSLATGAPMARILFPAAQAGVIIIPLMLYHQLQLIVSAWIASRWVHEKGREELASTPSPLGANSKDR